jgi:hypothetical protein
MKSYVTTRLTVEIYNACNKEVKKIIYSIDAFLEVLVQSYGDLNEARTLELQLIKLKQ